MASRNHNIGNFTNPILKLAIYKGGRKFSMSEFFKVATIGTKEKDVESILDLKQKGAAAAVPGQRRVRWFAPVHTIG